MVSFFSGSIYKGYKDCKPDKHCLDKSQMTFIHIHANYM